MCEPQTVFMRAVFKRVVKEKRGVRVQSSESE